MKPAVLSGFYKCPNPDHDVMHDVCICGHPMVVIQVLHRMGFCDIEQVKHENGVTVITDDRGSYLTMRPADDADQLLSMMLQHEQGDSPY